MIAIKRLFVIMFCFAFIFIVACSDDTNENSSDNESGNNKIEEKVIEPLGKYDPAIEVSTYGVSGSNVTFIEGEDHNNNIIREKFSEILGIDFENKWTVDVSQEMEKTNLAITSNDLPDIMKVNNMQMHQMIENGQVEDMTEYYDKYANELLKESLGYGGGEGFIGSTVDGKLYGIPLPIDYYEHVPIMYIREDWLNNLNLDAPTTLEELMEVAKAFTENDPDGNNEDDTYGIALDQELGMGFDAIASAFSAYRGQWYSDSSGGLVNGSTQPEMKMALEQMRKFFDEGVIDPEFGVKDWAKVDEDVGAGKIGIYFGRFWNPLHPLRLTLEHTPESDWGAYPIVTGVDGTIVPKRSPNVSSWIVVKKGIEHPEAAVKAMNLWAEMWMEDGEYADTFYGLQGSETYSDQELHQYAVPSFFDSPDKNIKIGKQFREALEDDNPEAITHPDGIWKWEAWENGGSMGWAYMKYLSESEFVLESYNEEFHNEEYLGPPTKSMERLSSTLDKLELETFTKIITGREPIDEFDEFVDQWESLGGDSITQEVNEWVDNQ